MIKTSTPEQLACATAKLFFNVCNEWGFLDSEIAKMLNVTHIKLKSLRRMSAYFNEQQMIVAGLLLTVYNDLSLVLKETVADKGKRSKRWLNTSNLNLANKTPKQLICADTSGIQEVRSLVALLKNSVVQN